MYIQDTGTLLIVMAISTMLLTLFIFFGNFILTCFELPGQTRIPQDKWRAVKKKV